MKEALIKTSTWYSIPVPDTTRKKQKEIALKILKADHGFYQTDQSIQSIRIQEIKVS